MASVGSPYGVPSSYSMVSPEFELPDFKDKTEKEVKPKKEEAVASIVEKIPQIEEKEQEKEVVIEIENLVYEKKSIPNVEFNVNGIPKEKFTPEYIQKLLDRISELEKDTSVANREEILQLNAELDEILSVLRQ